MWSARDRAPDASGRAESASEKKEVADRFGRPTGGDGLGERARPQLRGAGAQPQMGGRLHLHLDGRGLALCGGRARPVLAPGGGLVDERGHDDRARHRRAGDGDLAPRPPERAAASFRSWQPAWRDHKPRACAAFAIWLVATIYLFTAAIGFAALNRDTSSCSYWPWEPAG